MKMVSSWFKVVTLSVAPYPDQSPLVRTEVVLRRGDDGVGSDAVYGRVDERSQIPAPPSDANSLVNSTDSNYSVTFAVNSADSERESPSWSDNLFQDGTYHFPSQLSDISFQIYSPRSTLDHAPKNMHIKPSFQTPRESIM